MFIDECTYGGEGSLQPPDSNRDDVASNRSKLVASRVKNCWLLGRVPTASSSLFSVAFVDPENRSCNN
jgi:hypothetical protein